jgi:hypothetical protein
MGEPVPLPLQTPFSLSGDIKLTCSLCGCSGCRQGSQGLCPYEDCGKCLCSECIGKACECACQGHDTTSARQLEQLRSQRGASPSSSSSSISELHMSDDGDSDDSDYNHDYDDGDWSHVSSTR